MLLSPVYIESHPRRTTVFVSRMNLRDAAHASSSKSMKSFKPCAFNNFRTLAAHWSAATPLCSITSGLFPLQWGCIPPSTGMSSNKNSLFPRSVSRCLRGNLRGSALYERRTNAQIAHFFATTLFFATLPYFMGGRGRESRTSKRMPRVTSKHDSGHGYWIPVRCLVRTGPDARNAERRRRKRVAGSACCPQTASASNRTGRGERTRSERHSRQCRRLLP
jgi:hypothetical protein